MPLYETPEDKQHEREIVEATFAKYHDALIVKVPGRAKAQDFRVDVPSLGRKWLVETKDRYGQDPRGDWYTKAYMARRGIYIGKDKTDGLVARADAEGREPMLVWRTADAHIIAIGRSVQQSRIDPDWGGRKRNAKTRGDRPEAAYIVSLSMCKVWQPNWERWAMAHPGDLRLAARVVFGELL